MGSGPHNPPAPVTFFLPIRPRPKGNRDEIRKRGRRRWIAPPDWVERHQRAIRMCAAGYAPAEPWPGEVEVDVVFTFQVPISWGLRAARAAFEGKVRPSSANLGDRDNLEKLLLDALKGLFFVDDAQVVDGRVGKAWGPRDGYQVTIRYCEVFDERADDEAHEGRPREARAV